MIKRKIVDELKKHFSGRVINWRDDEKKIEEYFGGSEKSSEEFSPIFVEEKFCEETKLCARWLKVMVYAVPIIIILLSLISQSVSIEIL